MPSSITPPDACQKCQKRAMLMPRGSKWVCVDCLLASPPNVHELMARTRRAFVFAEFLAANNITADEVRRMTDEHWIETTGEMIRTQQAPPSMKPPSLETKLAIIQALETAQAVARV